MMQKNDAMSMVLLRSNYLCPPSWSIIQLNLLFLCLRFMQSRDLFSLWEPVWVCFCTALRKAATYWLPERMRRLIVALKCLCWSRRSLCHSFRLQPCFMWGCQVRLREVSPASREPASSNRLMTVQLLRRETQSCRKITQNKIEIFDACMPGPF
jgi:hypothetical protein